MDPDRVDGMKPKGIGLSEAVLSGNIRDRDPEPAVEDKKDSSGGGGGAGRDE